MQPNRSFLFTPGNHSRRVEKAFTTGADAVILDLEDAVAVAEKVATRAIVVEALQKSRVCRGYVRINSIDTEYCFDDLETVVGPWLDGIMLPKVERAADLQAVDWMLTSLERRHGLPLGSIDLLPIIETALGHANARSIAASSERLKRLSFGGGDYTRDLNIQWTFEEQELSAVRAEVVLASRLANIEAPIDTVFIHIKEPDHFDRSAQKGREFGFQGKLCIHPDQVAAANRAFTPSEAETVWARKIISSFQAAEAEGLASIQVDGYFVDYPIVEKAQRIVDVYDSVMSNSPSQ
ncbi:MAG: citrate lyase subunit beta/citryl-CoA lyase [Gammaproteobacteria bacterium]|jgi:citrate lyase subunit beta/citryl-CoA lyase